MKNKVKKYIRLPKKLVRDKIPEIHAQEHNVTVFYEPARDWPLEKKNKLLVEKLEEELRELFAEYCNGDVHVCCREAGDVLDVIDAIFKHVTEFVAGKKRSKCSGGTLALIQRAQFFIAFVKHHFNNLNFDIWVTSNRKSKKKEKGLFTELLVVKGETKDPKKYISLP